MLRWFLGAVLVLAVVAGVRARWRPDPEDVWKTAPLPPDLR
jgi:hypothetical protein